MGIFLALGSNLGNRKNNLQKAIKLLNECGVNTVKKSKIRQTKAVSKVKQPDFLNMCIKVVTQHNPQKLLKVIHLIEKEIGRDRSKLKRKGYERPRLIDIDILIFNDLKINKRNLQIPHPRMQERKFVMDPLNDIK